MCPHVVRDARRDVPNPLFDVAAVAAGGNHTCLLTSSSGVLCWGDNHYGQLGDGTSVDRTKPVPVSGLSSGVHSIASRDNHTCAVLDTGGVKCWGYNRYGQLGNTQNLRNSIAPNPLPLDVINLDSGVIAVTAGAAHTCALINTDGAKCWGWDRRGQLGDGPDCPDYTCTVPRDVSGLTSGVGAIDAGAYHTCVVLSAGGVKCWGQNDFGQLGASTGSPCVDETLDPIPCAQSPVDVPGLSDVLAIGAGGIDVPPLEDAHTCARILGGAVKCWGSNASGQLGDGQACGMVCQSPVDVMGLGEGAFTVAVGGRHTCASVNFGVVKCWGENALGQLGDGNSPNNSATPVDVCAGAQCGDGVCIPEQPCGALGNASAVSLGLDHSCVLVSSGGVKCWGGNAHGQLGDSGTCGALCDTPVDVLFPKGPLPDLVVTGMRIELETGGSCAFAIALGTRVEFHNIGSGAAGPFAVDVKGVQQTFSAGLAAGASGSLWFESYHYGEPSTAILDATSLVTENDEANSSHTKVVPIPTLPPTCTPTPTRTPLAPTLTANAASHRRRCQLRSHGQQYRCGAGAAARRRPALDAAVRFRAQTRTTTAASIRSMPR